MGTHPIFESDLDLSNRRLTDFQNGQKVEEGRIFDQQPTRACDQVWQVQPWLQGDHQAASWRQGQAHHPGQQHSPAPTIRNRVLRHVGRPVSTTTTAPTLNSEPLAVNTSELAASPSPTLAIPTSSRLTRLARPPRLNKFEEKINIDLSLRTEYEFWE